MRQYVASWWKEAQSNPLRAFWSVLIFVVGVQALLSLSELVVKVKGFALELLLAYRSVWQEPLHYLASLINVDWPAWASDAIAILAVSNVAALFVVQRLRHEVSLAHEHFSDITKSMKDGSLADGKLADELNQSQGFLSSSPLELLYIKWPWYYRFILPIVVGRMYLQEKRIFLGAMESTTKDLNPDNNPEISKILAIAFARKQYVSVRILRYYGVWLGAIILTCVILLIVSYALIYLPADI